MEAGIEAYLEKLADRYRAGAPAGWVRIVTWWAKLGDSPEEASLWATTSVDQVIVRRDDGSLMQRPIQPATPPEQDLMQIEPLQVGTPDEGWMLLKVEIEPDRIVRVDFEQGEPVRTETSLTSGWAAEVHQYLERHRAELESLSDGEATPDRVRGTARRRRTACAGGACSVAEH